MTKDLKDLQQQYWELDKEAGKYNRPEFDEVYRIIKDLTKERDDVGDKGNLALPLVTGSVIDEALRLAGFANDGAFVADFKKYREIEQQARELQLQMVEMMMAEQQPPKPQQVQGWRFVPMEVFAPKSIHPIIVEKWDEDAKEGKGVFANHFQIPQEDEFLDEFLGVEAYGLRYSFVPYLDELKQFGIVDGVDGHKPFFSKELARGLFCVLKEASNYLKANTDKPQAIKNEIARLTNEFDSIPIWGLFFQILFLQGLCRLLEGVNINEGDDGYNEASSLYEWLCLELAKKELDFCFKPYGANDREQLKPFCAYLMSTEVGKMVQGHIFGKEPQPEQANNRETTDAQSLNPEPQQAQPKQTHKTTRGKGRPKETLKDKMIDDADGSKLQKLHTKICGKKGKDAALIILACIKKGWMAKPTYTQVTNEFGDIGSKTGYNKYLKETRFAKEEIEGVMSSLE